MTAYATPADLAARYGAAELLALADRDGDGVADAGVVEAALDAACTLADGYLRGRYALPVLVPPPDLLAAVCDLARALLYTLDAPQIVTDRDAAARRWLAAVASGAVQLDLPPAAAPAAGGLVEFVNGTDSVFGRGRW